MATSNSDAIGQGESHGVVRSETNIRATPDALRRKISSTTWLDSKFYDNLKSVMDLHKFECHNIYYADETGDYFIKGDSTGCIGGANSSEGSNEDLFVTYLKHFVAYTRCNKEVLLILDNPETHVFLVVIDLDTKNGVILLTIPPHTSHKLQPLDVSCHKPFKTAYSRAVDDWLRSYPGKSITIYDIPEFVSHTQIHGHTAQNIISGFQRTGIYPFNQDMFCETEFAPAVVIDRDIPISSYEYQADVFQSSFKETPVSYSMSESPNISQEPTTSTETANPNVEQRVLNASK
uniref:DDE-1 domain-containing protein n=1 Tax=Octopus bimaculoides TaxID=37653 RepID=A0A0L8HZN1_OCTBM